MTHITNIIDGAVGMPKPWEGLGKVALGLISWLKSTPLWELLLTDLLCQNAQQTEDYARKWYRQSRCHLTKDLVIHLALTRPPNPSSKGVSLLVGLVGGMASLSAR